MLTQAELVVRQRAKVEEVTSVLGISEEDAARVLRKFKWWVPHAMHRPQ